MLRGWQWAGAILQNGQGNPGPLNALKTQFAANHGGMTPGQAMQQRHTATATTPVRRGV